MKGIINEDHHQQIVRNTSPKPGVNNNNSNLERKIRCQKEQGGALNCPRCNSTNTKFCYYNNYSLTQPRYFCKACRRYWTEGGSLRNIPVGGGSRKNKKPSSNLSTSPNSNINSNKILHDLPQNPKITTTTNPHSQDLNLSFLPSSHHHHHQFSGIVVGGGNPTIASTTLSSSHQVSAMELLTGMTSNNSRGLNCFIPMRSSVVGHDHPGSVYTTGFPDLVHNDQFKSSLGFSLDGYGAVVSTDDASNNNGVGGRLLQLPLFEDLKQESNGVEDGKQGADSTTTGYWTGMLGEGSW